MNERELRQLITKLKGEYEGLKASATVEELRAKADEIKEASEKLTLELQVRANELPPINNLEPQSTIAEKVETEVELDRRYQEAFANAIAGRTLSEEQRELVNSISKGELRAATPPDTDPYFTANVPSDGGLIVPKGIADRVEQYKRDNAEDLTKYVDVVRTNVRSGKVVFQKVPTLYDAPTVAEWEKFQDAPTIEFEEKEYSIKDYGYIIRIPNTLLEDSFANIMALVGDYIAKNTVFKRNGLILSHLNTIYDEPETIATVNDVKDILNVKLDRVFSNSANVFTNQDGFNFLDKLKDEDGNYLLQPDVLDPTQHRLLGKRVVVFSNKTLPNHTVVEGEPGETTVTAPIYFGDLREVIKFFDRGAYEIKVTDIGGGAFEMNTTNIRVFDRFGVTSFDTEGVVAGAITIP